MVSVNPKNDAFGGGGIVRSAPPTAGPRGALAALSGTPGGGPVGGVNPPSTPFFARPNEGTNVRIPYSRVVPLSDPRGGGLTQTGTAQDYADRGYDITPLQHDSYRKTVMNETDTLHPGRLAFVLAKRSGGILAAAPGTGGSSDPAVLQNLTYAVNSAMAPQLPGPHRFQKLCSFEYLQRYVNVKVNHSGKYVISLGTAPSRDVSTNVRTPRVPTSRSVIKDKWNKGLLRQLAETAFDRVDAIARKDQDRVGTEAKDAATENDWNATEVDRALRSQLLANLYVGFDDGTEAQKRGSIETMAKVSDEDGGEGKKVGWTGMPDGDATLLSIGDLAKRAGEWGSPINMDPTVHATTDLPSRFVVNGVRMSSLDKHPMRSQGIFTMDTSAFLRGRGIDSEMVGGSTPGGPGYPFNVSRNLGDEVAFAMLEEELIEMGLFDWTPDGILLSKLDNVPHDPLEVR